MCNVNMYEAKTNLSKYVELLRSGKEKEVYLCCRGVRVAKITLVDEPAKKSLLGIAKGVLPDLPDGFDDPKLDEEIAKDFDL